MEELDEESRPIRDRRVAMLLMELKADAPIYDQSTAMLLRLVRTIAALAATARLLS
jgi:hypothetical protein